MKLSLPVRGFRYCLKIQNDLNRLAERCKANALKLNVGKFKSLTFSRLRHPIEFLYMLGCIILDCVDSINDLRVILDSKMSFTGHIDDMVAKVLAMLGLSREFRDPYTLKTLYVSVVRPKLECAGCVWRLFYGTHIDRIEHCVVWDGRTCAIFLHTWTDLR
jgi:hypothetical protein